MSINISILLILMMLKSISSQLTKSEKCGSFNSCFDCANAKCEWSNSICMNSSVDSKY